MTATATRVSGMAWPSGADTATAAAGGRKARDSTVSKWRRVVVAAFGTLGILGMWFLLYATVLSAIQERSDQGRLYNSFRSQLALETSPIGAPIAHGQPVALIDVPKAGISNLVVVEGTTSEDLRRGPGHRSDSPLPGQIGTSYVFGRGVMFGAPFRHLASLKAGDIVTVITGQGTFAFRVADVRRAGDRLPPAVAPGGSRVTLVSSTSNGWRSGWAPDHVIYVDADLARGPASGLPAPLPSAVSGRAQAMQGDPKALVPMIFWLEGLALAVIAVVWASIRWGRLQTWIVGAPILIGMLWGTSGALSAFLPNLV